MNSSTIWTEHGVDWKVVGQLHTKDILTFVEEIAQSPRLNELKYFFWDVTEVTEYVDDDDDVELSANYSVSLEVYNNRLAGALIANTPAMLAFCEEYIKTMKAMESPWEMKVFSDLDEARKWIESKV